MLSAYCAIRNVTRTKYSGNVVRVYASITRLLSVIRMVIGSTWSNSCNTLNSSWSCFFVSTSLGDGWCITGSGTVLIGERTGSSRIDSGNCIIISRAIVETSVSVVIISDAGYGGAGRSDASRAAPVHRVARSSAYCGPVKCDLIIPKCCRKIRRSREDGCSRRTWTTWWFFFLCTGDDSETKKGYENYV